MTDEDSKSHPLAWLTCFLNTLLCYNVPFKCWMSVVDTTSAGGDVSIVSLAVVVLYVQKKVCHRGRYGDNRNGMLASAGKHAVRTTRQAPRVLWQHTDQRAALVTFHCKCILVTLMWGFRVCVVECIWTAQWNHFSRSWYLHWWLIGDWLMPKYCLLCLCCLEMTLNGSSALSKALFWVYKGFLVFGLGGFYHWGAIRKPITKKRIFNGVDVWTVDPD